MKRRQILISLCFIFTLIAGCGLTHQAAAFDRQESKSDFEIPLLQFDLFNYKSVDTERAALETCASLNQNQGGNWRVFSWNPQTSTPAYLYGSGQIVASSLDSKDEVESLAMSIIETNQPVFKTSGENLRHKKTTQAMGKWAVHYEQMYAGIPVWQAGARLVFTETGKLFVMGSDCYSDINVNPDPSLSLTVAERIARDDVPFDALTDAISDDGALLILPVPVSETEVSHHLVWRVRVETSDPIGIWVTHIDAHTGEILWRYNDVHFALDGETRGDIEPATYCNPIEEQSLSWTRVDVDGFGSVISDETGAWSVNVPGSDPVNVTAGLTGPYININNLDGDNALFSGVATPGVPFTVMFDDANSRRDERDCFDAINDIHNFISRFDPSFGYINQTIECFVGIDQTCNAYWNGTINFYNEGGGCANTGQIQGVVHHEFGHGIQDHIIGYQGDQGLGEGNGDIIANLITQESIIGRGFNLNQCTSGIRNSDNTLIYPDNVIGAPIHAAGRVIAGFNWDLMISLQADFGEDAGTITAAELWHFGRILLQPITQPAQVLSVFITDDDDGNLSNGTPHFNYICAAAVNHGFSCPEVFDGVVIQHDELSDTVETGEHDIEALIWSTDGFVLQDSIFVAYSVNGGPFVDIAMEPSGPTNEYHATLPFLDHSSHVEYYLRARDNVGNVRVDPTGAPAAVYSFDIARILDFMEEDSGWIVDLEGTDDATTGIWEWAFPYGSEAAPGADHTPGLNFYCYVTGNGLQGEPASLNDVDDGTTTLYSPIYYLGGADAALLTYWRWYSNNTSFNPNDDLWIVQGRMDDGPWLDIENTQDYQNAWVEVESDLYEIFSGEMGALQLRFIASDLYGGSIVEAALDDLKLMAQGAHSDIGELLPEMQFVLSGSRSNPVVGQTEISFQVPRTVSVELSMFDLNGRLVRQLTNSEFTPGAHSVAWDGRDERGRPAASGVYYCRMKADEFTFSRKVVLSQ